MTTFSFAHKNTTVTLNSVEKIQLGNASDNAGQYRGDVVDCEILQVKETEFYTNILAKVVGNEGYVVCANYLPHMLENGQIEAKLYSTNARVVGQFGFKDLNQCAVSMGFEPMESHVRPFDILFKSGEKLEELGTSEEDIRDFLARSYAGQEVESVTAKQL